ncbi:MAG: hypothetical protein IJB91_03640 [Oscillospiraceae bacterium]|nr:hypothetical protein [Oscillospiraceae bacterium]
MADWKKIKTEYITTETSYRKLAQKYGLDQATIARRAKKEGWVSNRQQNASKTQAKIIDKISDKTADKMARIEGITDKLLTKLDQAVNELDLVIVTRKIKTDNGTTEETTEYREAREGGIVDRSGLRQITAALKDLKEIQMLKSELDRREQEARIANLQRQAAADSDDDDETGVVLLPPVKGG